VEVIPYVISMILLSIVRINLYFVVLDVEILIEIISNVGYYVKLLKKKWILNYYIHLKKSIQKQP
jgi:hypothetical protein